MLLHEGYHNCSTLLSSGGLRRRSSTKLEYSPVDTSLHTATDQVPPPYLRHLRTSIDDDASSKNTVGRAVSDSGFLRGEEDQDAAASPAAAGVLGRFASLSASALSSSLPLLRGLSSSFTRSSDSSNSCSDAPQQQHGQSTYEQLARQDAASTRMLLSRDRAAMQAAARRPTAGMRPARELEHRISSSSCSSASSYVSCKLGEVLAGNAAVDQGNGLLGDAAEAGYLEGGSPGGARLLLAATVGKVAYTFKSDKDTTKSD